MGNTWHGAMFPTSPHGSLAVGARLPFWMTSVWASGNWRNISCARPPWNRDWMRDAERCEIECLGMPWQKKQMMTTNGCNLSPLHEGSGQKIALDY